MVEKDNSQQPTKFNMAIATLETMHKGLNHVNNCSIEGDLISWSEGLMTLRRDVSPFITEDELSKINEKINTMNKEKWIYKKPKVRGLKVIPSQLSRVYNQLDDLTMYIKWAMNKAGLLMPKSDDPRFAVEQ